MPQLTCSTLRAFKSGITDREILVNCDEARFFVSPDATVVQLEAVRAEWAAYINGRKAELQNRSLLTAEQLKHPRFRTKNPPKDLHEIKLHGYPPHVESLVHACLDSLDADGFATAVNDLLVYAAGISASSKKGTREYARVPELYRECPHIPWEGNKRPPENTRLTAFLMVLWKHRLVAFPSGLFWGLTHLHGNCFTDEAELYGPQAEHIFWLAGQRKMQRMAMISLALMSHGFTDVGDIDHAVIESILTPAATVKGKARGYSLAKLDTLRACQIAHYAGDPELVARIPVSYQELLKSPPASSRNDPDFGWVQRHAELNLWADAAREYIASITNTVGIKHYIDPINFLLDFVAEEQSVPRDPLDYCRADHKPGRSYRQWLAESGRSPNRCAQLIRAAVPFFDWLLVERASDEWGHILPEYRSPIPPKDIPPTADFASGQTNRSAIPMRFLRMMREIIEGENFAWPKTLKSDWFSWANPETGQIERVWSPVRAYFYLLRLMLPVREIQVRLLDSGEGDERIYDPAGGWVKNTWPTRLRDRRRKPQGFLREIWSAEEGRFFNGLFISTNKIQDRATGFTDTGYEVPYCPDEILDLYVRLRDWQREYNPQAHPVTRGDLTSDSKLRAAPDVAKRLPKNYWLFRDAALRSTPNEPVGQNRLAHFWRALLAELERRLEAEGYTNEDGSKIVLVHGYRENEDGTAKENQPTKVEFDPHSLRVAGLTWMMEAGVSIHILSQFVAGHATILMTLYYQKPSTGEIRRQLEEAYDRFDEIEDRNFAGWLASQPVEVLQNLSVYNTEEGKMAAEQVQSALWAFLDVGICPNGGTLCHEGGPRIEKRGTKNNYYSPVKGGPRNCPLCRFLVTGPAFLAGLVAKFNETAGQLRELLQSLQEKERQVRDAVAGARVSGRELSRQEQRAIERGEEAKQTLHREIEVRSETLSALLGLIRRVEVVMEEQRASARDKNALVLAGDLGDLRVQLEQCSEYELWTRICEESEFFPGVDAKLPALRRGQLYNLLLAHNDRPPVFATMTDEQLRLQGNAVARLLRTTLGSDGLVNDLINGHRTLEELGLDDALDQVLASASRSVGITITAPAVVGAGPRLAIPSVPISEVPNGD